MSETPPSKKVSTMVTLKNLDDVPGYDRLSHLIKLNPHVDTGSSGEDIVANHHRYTVQDAGERDNSTKDQAHKEYEAYKKSCNLMLCNRPSCTVEELKKGYRRHAVSKHPDKGGNTESFQKLDECYKDLLRPLQNNFSEEYQPDKPVVAKRQSTVRVNLKTSSLNPLVFSKTTTQVTPVRTRPLRLADMMHAPAAKVNPAPVSDRWPIKILSGTKPFPKPPAEIPGHIIGEPIRKPEHFVISDDESTTDSSENETQEKTSHKYEVPILKTWENDACFYRHETKPTCENDVYCVWGNEKCRNRTRPPQQNLEKFQLNESDSETESDSEKGNLQNESPANSVPNSAGDAGSRSNDRSSKSSLAGANSDNAPRMRFKERQQQAAAEDLKAELQRRVDADAKQFWKDHFSEKNNV